MQQKCLGHWGTMFNCKNQIKVQVDRRQDTDQAAPLAFCPLTVKGPPPPNSDACGWRRPATERCFCLVFLLIYPF